MKETDKKPKWRSNLRSIKFQLFTGFMVIVLMVLVIVGFLQGYWLQNAQYSSLENLLLSRLHNVDKAELINLKTQEDILVQAEGLASKMMDLQVSVSFFNAKGIAIFSSEKDLRETYHHSLLLLDHTIRSQRYAPPELPSDAYMEFLKTPHVFEQFRVGENEAGERYIMLLSKLGPENSFSGLLQLSLPLQETDSALRAQMLTYIWIAFLGILVGGLLLLFLLTFLLRPLRDMTRRLVNMDENALKDALPSYNRQAEMHQLSQSFNQLLERLNIAFEKDQVVKAQLKSFVSDAAHELRTPITSIRGFAEVLTMGEGTDKDQLHRGLDTIISESDRLTRLVNHLLLLSKLDQGQETPYVPIALSEVIEGLKPQFELLGKTRSVTTSLECEGTMLGNQDQLQQIIINLYHNACQYTDERNGQIAMQLTCKNINGQNRLVFSIADNGCGIPEESLPFVFDRFYRVEAHRSRKTGGEGLGLSIVKALVEAHRGQVSVENLAPSGTKFTLEFPCL